jgi:hypothetical protein
MGPTAEDTGNSKTMMHDSESGADVSSTTSEMMAENEAASDDAGGGSGSNNSDKEGMPLDAQKDDNLVKWAQGTVMLVLLLSAATVATLSYVLLSNSEASSFQAQVRIVVKMSLV